MEFKLKNIFYDILFSYIKVLFAMFCIFLIQTINILKMFIDILIIAIQVSIPVSFFQGE